ncbi:hypothetical protein F-liban_155 [Faustovirus]|nr:hypothetical protein F-liban_155 [Faustovirus]
MSSNFTVLSRVLFAGIVLGLIIAGVGVGCDIVSMSIVGVVLMTVSATASCVNHCVWLCRHYYEPIDTSIPDSEIYYRIYQYQV